MAGQDKRINDLNPLSGADVANNDVMPIVDQSAFETKKINFQDLKSRITEESAPLSSPIFTGEPKAPTVTPSNDSSTRIATTEFVQNALTNVTVGDATTTDKGIVKLAGDLGGTADLPTVPGLADKAPIDSPSFTGVPTSPTVADNSDNSNKIATTAFVQSALGESAVPDATTTVKGKIKLAGDLSGTADLPTVPALESKVSGPVISSDNRLVRWNGVTGKAIKNSGVILDDSDQMSGLESVTTTALNADLMRVNESIDSSATGENAMIIANNSRVILTNASLVSISGISATTAGKVTTIVNKTGKNIRVIHNYSGFLLDNRFTLPDGKDIDLKPDASITVARSVSYGSHIVQGGSGSGDGSKTLETIFQLTADEPLSDWTFLNDDLSISKVDPLFGDASYELKMTNLAMATYKVIPVDIGFRGTTVALTLNYLMPQGSARVLLLDQDNNIIEGATFDIPAANGKEKFGTTVFIPSSVTGIRFKAESRATVAGGSFKFDNVELSSDLLKSVDIEDKYQAIRLTTTEAVVSNTNLDGLTKTLARGNSTLFNLSTSGVTFTGPCDFKVSVFSERANNDMFIRVMLNGAIVESEDNRGTSSGGIASTSWSFPVTTDDVVTFATNSTVTLVSISIFAKARTKSIVAPTDQVTERSIAFRWRSAADGITEANLSTAGKIGDYVTGQYAANSNTLTQCTTRPTQTDADMSLNGLRIYARAFNAASTAALPSRLVIKIAEPNQMAACSLNGKDAAGNNLSLAYLLFSNATETQFYERGLMYQTFDPSTGILTIDAGSSAPKTTDHAFPFSAGGSTSPSAYIRFTASKLAQGVAIPTRGPYLYLNNSSGQSIPPSEIILMTGWTVVDDNRNGWNNVDSSYTIPEDGIYQINVQRWISSSASNATIVARLRFNVNGELSRIGPPVTGTTLTTGSSSISPTISTSVPLKKGDILTFYVDHSYSGNRAFHTSNFTNYLSITKTGDL